VSAAPRTQPIVKPPPVARRKDDYYGPGTAPAIGAPKTPSWAVGAPMPANPTLTAAQQAAWAAGFNPPENTATDTTSGVGTWGYDINTDPNVIEARNQEQLGSQQLDADLARARRQAIIRFGDSSLAQLGGFGLDPTDAAAAQQNYLAGNADLARIDKGHKDRRTAIINQLAARGILGSGELGYSQGEEDLQYGQQTYDARNKVLDYLNQVNQSYLDRKSSLRQATLQALQQAYQFGLTNPQMYAGGGGTSAGGPSGGDWTYQLQGRQTGYNPQSLLSLAQSSAPSYGGSQLQPHMIMNEGQVFTDASGRQYVNVKYTDPTGRAGSSTERVYV
jgi:hypothetical protein